MNICISNADYLVRDTDRIERGVDLLINNNKIVSIGRNLPVSSDTMVLDAKGCAVIPGLVNAHTHLYQNFLKGASAGLKLEEWFNTDLFPLIKKILQEQKSGNTRLNYLWSMIGSIEMIRGGVTCCQNMDVSTITTLPGIFKAWDEIGFRGVGTVNLANRTGWVSSGLISEDLKLYRSIEKLIENEHDPGHRIRIALGPSAPFLCDGHLLRWVAGTAAAYDLGVQIHVSETVEEVESSLKERGVTPVGRLAAAGLLSERLSAVHCVRVNQEDISLLRNGNVVVVSCPKSNMKLGSGIMPWSTLKENGLRIALGSDGCASNDLLDMWEEMRSAAFVASLNSSDLSKVSPSDVFRAATAGGAAACRFSTGILDPGMLADVVLVDLQAPHVRPVHNILNTLVYCVRASDVKDVIIDGNVVMLNRIITTVDESLLMEEFEQAANKLYQ
ncbi:MAG: amidohydrolase family protein [Spirochaetales bacterium]|nr:amidohydrolase family protein [Spirochaetales bacterium]